MIDISNGQIRNLPRHEDKEVQRMLKLLQAANREVMMESISGEKNTVLGKRIVYLNRIRFAM